MGRSWQFYVAPGPETEPLPIAPSPWHDERWVKLPKEHWRLILDVAETIDSYKADRLRAYSWTREFNTNNVINVHPQELAPLLPFLEQVAQHIEQAPPLVPYATEEVPDEYENGELVRMVQAIAAVFQEAIRLQQPFRAWNE